MNDRRGELDPGSARRLGRGYLRIFAEVRRGRAPMPYLPPTYPGKGKGAGREPYPLTTYRIPTPYLPRHVSRAVRIKARVITASACHICGGSR